MFNARSGFCERLPLDPQYRIQQHFAGKNMLAILPHYSADQEVNYYTRIHTVHDSAGLRFEYRLVSELISR